MNKKLKVKNQKLKVIGKGFTLIELLLYISITSVILLVMSGYIIVVLQARVKNQTIAEVDQQATQVIQLITQTARNAEAINTPSQASSGPTLSLATYNINENPTVFDSTSGTIRVTQGGGGPHSLTNSRVIASNLIFYNLSKPNTPGTIRTQFTLTHLNPEGRNEYDYTKTYYASASLR